MRIYLARHGDTRTPGRLLGAANPALSPTGLAQSRALAESLAGQGVERVISSGLLRASECAAVVAERCAAPHAVDPRLDEIGHGDWDGLTWAEIERLDPELAGRKISAWWGVTPPHGETTETFAARLTAFWDELRASETQTVAIVAHLAVNSCLAGLVRYGRIDWSAALAFQQEHGEAILIDVTV